MQVAGLDRHLFFGQGGLRLTDDFGNNLLQVDLVGIVEVFRFVEAVEHRDVAQQVGQPFRLGVAPLHEHLLALLVHLGGEYGLHVSPDTAHGSFEFVCDVLGQLPFYAALLFLLGDVVDGNFEGVVLEDDTFDEERAAALVESHRLGDELFLHIGVIQFLGDKVVDLFQVLLLEQIVGR